MRRTDHSKSAGDVVAALDVGTAKVACLVAWPDTAGNLLLGGIGQQRSRGIKSGTVTDGDEAERAVRAAIGQAERMAGVTVDRVRLAMVCGRIGMANFVARARLAAPVARQVDVERVRVGAEAYLERCGRTLVQLAHAEWHLDGAAGIRDPRGMAGRELALGLVAITADEGPTRNLVAIVERCHVVVEQIIAAPVASALAVTTPEERAIGTLVVDIGAGTTTLARFADGRLDYLEAIPVGGDHITYDIARALVTAVAEAERIKTLYGTLVKASSDDSELLSYPMIGNGEPVPYQTSKARIRGIIEPRVEAWLSLVEERLAGRGCGRLSGATALGTVLTGGASQLLGLDTAWMQRFGGIARIGRPTPIGRMPESLCSPALSTALGLVQAESASPARAGDGAGYGYIDRVQQWIRNSF